MILEFKKINGKYISENETAYNPECDIAFVKISNFNTKLFSYNGVNIYNSEITAKILCTQYNKEVSDYLHSLKASVTSIDEDFDFVMRDEGLTNILGETRLIRINFTYNIKISDADCRDCNC